MSLVFAILIFVAILCVIVIAHEAGHFFIARISGVAVDEFGVGFPPRIHAWTRRSTEYSLNLIPLGGFVRLKGESSDNDKANENDSFVKAKPYKKMLILLAGVSANVLLAFTLLFVTYAIGSTSVVPDSLPKSAIIKNQHIAVMQVEENSPAAKANLKPGDEIVSINGQTILSADELNLAKTKEAVLTILIKRELKLQTIVVQRSNTSELMGIAHAPVATIQYSLFGSIAQAFHTTVNSLVAIIRGLADLLFQLVIHQKVSPDLTGVVGVAYMTKTVTSFGIVSVLQFTALLSLNLAVVNLVPIPTLDGGRLFMVIWETLRRKKISISAEERLQRWSFIGLVILIILVTYRDIARITQGLLG